jgi:NitT/TauT family transport system substrate-binding protein
MVIGASLALAACGSSAGGSSHPAGPEKTDLTVAAVPGEGCAAVFVAQQQGLFAKQGLHVKIEPVVSSSTVIPSMLHGSVDVACGQYTSYIAADVAGIAKMHILAAGYALGPHVQEVIVPAHTSVRSLADLKGKTVAVNVPNSETTDLLYTALSAYGITPAQVHVVPMPFPAMLAALAAKRVDAAYEIQPYVTEGQKTQGVQELADIDSGPSQNFPIAGFGVLSSWAAKYPHTAAAFAQAIEQANATSTTNLAVLQHALSGALHLSAAITDAMPTGNFPTRIDTVQLQRVADLMLQYGQLKSSFQVKTLVGG